MKLLRNLLLVVTFSLVGIHYAGAFEPGACKADEAKYCKDAPTANDGKKKCMKEHMSQLSDACKANILDVAVEKKEKSSGKN